MKIIYTKTIMDKIIEAKAVADSINKEVEKIEITPEEVVELRQCLNMCQRAVTRSGFFGYVMGIRVYVVAEDEF